MKALWTLIILACDYLIASRILSFVLICLFQSFRTWWYSCILNVLCILVKNKLVDLVNVCGVNVIYLLGQTGVRDSLDRNLSSVTGIVQQGPCCGLLITSQSSCSRQRTLALLFILWESVRPVRVALAFPSHRPYAFELHNVSFIEGLVNNRIKEP